MSLNSNKPNITTYIIEDTDLIITLKVIPTESLIYNIVSTMNLVDTGLYNTITVELLNR